MARRLRRRPFITSTLGQRLVISGDPHLMCTGMARACMDHFLVFTTTFWCCYNSGGLAQSFYKYLLLWPW